MTTDSYPAPLLARLRAGSRRRTGLVHRAAARPELVGVLALAGVLNLWA